MQEQLGLDKGEVMAPPSSGFAHVRLGTQHLLHSSVRVMEKLSFLRLRKAQMVFFFPQFIAHAVRPAMCTFRTWGTR